MPEPLTAVDLCCGAGGWACAARGLPIRFVAVADLDDQCLDTWRINHCGEHPHCALLNADLATPIGLHELRSAVASPPDLVLGGIPCEPISTARYCGGQLGRPSAAILDAWHSLVDAVLCLVNVWNPRWWAIEDVIQIERHLPLPLLHGREIPRRRLDAVNFGPQRRLRTFLGEFPVPAPGAPGRRVLGDCLLPGPFRTIFRAERYRQRSRGRNAARVGTDVMRVMPADEASPTICGGLDRGSRQRRSFMVRHNGGVRCLDWREAALLQGFPPDYTFVGGLQATQKQIGQAIQIDLGRAILQAICAEAAAGGPKTRKG